MDGPCGTDRGWRAGAVWGEAGGRRGLVRFVWAVGWRGRCLLLVLEEGHPLDGQLQEVLRPLLVEALEEPHGVNLTVAPLSPDQRSRPPATTLPALPPFQDEIQMQVLRRDILHGALDGAKEGVPSLRWRCRCS